VHITEAQVMIQILKRQLKEYLYSLNYQKDRRIVDQMYKDNDLDVSLLEVYKFHVAKDKAIFNALNMMQTRGTNYISFIWAPLEKQEEL
jgi:hypothetical protein